MKPKHKELDKDERGITIMNERNLAIICERDDLFSFPELNEKLYLHYKGFDRIQNLDKYTNLVALWLNNNGIHKIEGLSHLKNLKSLFLNHNLISKIENLEGCTNLMSLNLSHNKIQRVEGLLDLQRLQNLNLSYNAIQYYDEIKELSLMQSVTNIDLSHNSIDYDENVLDIFVQMTAVACIYLKGNPIVRKFPNYRKRFIGYVPTLLYLDDKPVFEGERRISEAWVKEGRLGEENERNVLAKERREDQIKSFKDTESKVIQAEKKREEYVQRAKDNFEKIKNEIMEKLQMAQRAGDRIAQSQLEQQLQEEEDKLRDIQVNINNLVIEKINPYQCLSITRDKNGEIIVLNKTEEEAQFIKQKLYNEEIIEMSKSQEQKRREELQRKREEQIMKQIEEDEQESESGIIDYNKQYKDFIFEKKQQLTVPKPIKFDLPKKNEEPLQNENQIRQKEWQMLRQNWTQEYDELLEALLNSNNFDFEEVSKEMKKIFRELNVNNVPCEPDDLQKIWTYVELTKYRKRNIPLYKEKQTKNDQEEQIQDDTQQNQQNPLVDQLQLEKQDNSQEVQQVFQQIEKKAQVIDLDELD